MRKSNAEYVNNASTSFNLVCIKGDHKRKNTKDHKNEYDKTKDRVLGAMPNEVFGAMPNGCKTYGIHHLAPAMAGGR